MFWTNEISRDLSLRCVSRIDILYRNSRHYICLHHFRFAPYDLTISYINLPIVQRIPFVQNKETILDSAVLSICAA